MLGAIWLNCRGGLEVVLPTSRKEIAGAITVPGQRTHRATGVASAGHRKEANVRITEIPSPAK